MTAHGCAGGLKKTYGLRSGSHAIDISYVSLTCPSKHRHVVILFTVIPRRRTISIAFYYVHGDTEDLFSSQTPGSERSSVDRSVTRKTSDLRTDRCPDSHWKVIHRSLNTRNVHMKYRILTSDGLKAMAYVKILRYVCQRPQCQQFWY